MGDTQKSRSFETALQELEERVRLLDNGELPLEESLQFFEQGVQLVRECQHLLDAAEKKIIEITQSTDNIQETPIQRTESSHV